MRQLIFISLLGFYITGFGQEIKAIQFIDYDSVIKDIKGTKSNIDLSSKWDYESLLLLDTTDIFEINKIRPDIVKDFRKTYSLPFLDRYKKFYPADSKSIMEYFFKKDLTIILFSAFDNGIDTKHRSIDSKIYIKDDIKAIYTIYGNTWSECYRISLLKDKFLIELLYKIQE